MCENHAFSVNTDQDDVLTYTRSDDIQDGGAFVEKVHTVKEVGERLWDDGYEIGVF